MNQSEIGSDADVNVITFFRLLGETLETFSIETDTETAAFEDEILSGSRESRLSRDQERIPVWY